VKLNFESRRFGSEAMNSKLLVELIPLSCAVPTLREFQYQRDLGFNTPTLCVEILYQFENKMSPMNCYKYNADVYFKEHLCDIKITFGIKKVFLFDTPMALPRVVHFDFSSIFEKL